MESERERLKLFRRALKKEDQEAFDRLFDRAKMHTSAGVYMARPLPMESILLSICLEHGKMIEDILGLLKEISAQRLAISPAGRLQGFPPRGRLLPELADWPTSTILKNFI
jgi:hypothetical protein